MESLIPWRFILFGLACAGFVYLQFSLAHRQWRRLKGEQPTEIDLEYVRMENCLPKSFRAKVNEWLQLPSLTAEGAPERIIPKGRERIRVTGPLSIGPGEDTGDILVVQGNFSCGAQCRITREVWARGNATIGRQSQVQALAADGEMVLEDGVSVARWVDSSEELRVGAKCRIGARATSLKAVRLGLGAEALSVYAAQVSTADWDGSMDGAGASDVGEFLEIGPPEGPAVPAEALQKAGLEPSKLVQLSPACWSYLGDFRPFVRIRLRAGLVVKGCCDLPGGSVLSGDIKAHGALLVGSSSACEGNLVSEGDIHLGRGCRFNGVIHAGGSLLLSTGTRGVVNKDLVAAYASEDLYVERNVAVAGKLGSGGKVVVIDSAPAEEWRRRRGIRET